jgi:hypothetical protein
MFQKYFSKIIAAIVIAGSIVPFAFIQSPAQAHPPADNTPLPKFTLKDPCALDPNNLVDNGSMGPGNSTQYGVVADGWNPFIYDGTPPTFNWVSNEQIDPNGSQQIYSTNPFDAGIEQTVQNLQPNSYYMFRLGYSLAAKSYSGPNVRVDSIGRKVGVDPFGGTDPKSPNVIWGPDYFNGQSALNIPEMTMVFAARSSSATIFLRAMATDGSSGENRVWFDAVCMQALPDFPTATPAAPTATPVPPTSTPRPIPTRAPATRVPPTRMMTPTPKEILRAPDTPTPTAVAFIAPAPATSEPRYARPEPTPEPRPLINLGQGAMAGLGTLLMIGGVLSFGIGTVLWRRID